MTMSANRGSGDNIKVTITYGPVVAYVEENVGHLRNFYAYLGQLIDQIDSEAREKVAND